MGSAPSASPALNLTSFRPNPVSKNVSTGIERLSIERNDRFSLYLLLRRDARIGGDARLRRARPRCCFGRLRCRAWLR